MTSISFNPCSVQVWSTSMDSRTLSFTEISVIRMTETGVVKIADFGQAKLLGDLNDILQTTQPGAVLYMPPEALKKKKKRYTAKVDSFSLGVLMLEICTQSPPSSGLDGINYEIEVKRREDDLRLLDDAHPLKPLIVWCLQYEELRPTVDVIHGFIRNDVQSKVRMVVHASYLWFTFATCSMEACICRLLWMQQWCVCIYVQIPTCSPQHFICIYCIYVYVYTIICI